MDCLNKSLSDSNLNMTSQAEITPPNYVCARIKRKRSSDHCSSDFQEEMRNMLTALTDKVEKNSSSLTQTVKEIRLAIANIESSVSFVTTINEDLQKKLESMESQRKKDLEYISRLENQLEDVQKICRKTSIEIRNVPNAQNETKEDLVSMVTSLSESVGCQKITKMDIKDIYRVKKNKDNDNKTVVLELTSVLTKTDLLKSCKSFNYRNKSAKLSLKHLGFKTNGDSPIFVSEQLTAKGARLYFLARDLVRRKLYKYCWTAFGKVYLRKDDVSPIIMVMSEAQLQTISKNEI